MSRQRLAATSSTFVLILTAAFFGSETAAQAATAAEVDKAGAQVRYLGEHVYPTIYAGVSVDQSVGVVSLQVTAPGSAADALAAAAGGIPVLTTIVAHSFQTLMDLQQRVISDDALWTSQGALLTAIAPDLVSNKLLIGLQDWSDVIAAAMEVRYGAGNILVVQQTAGVAAAASRTADTAPYNGGDALRNSTGQYCTAGFGVHYQSSSTKFTGPYMVTAGHCFPHGAAVFHNGVQIGTAYRSSSVYKDYGTDVEMIYMAGKTSKYIWETNTARAQNDGTITYPAIGSTICQSGAATNKRCGTVKTVNACFYNSTFRLHWCHQDYATSTSLLVAQGDSGGPVFQAYTANGVRWNSAVGMPSIAAAPVYTCTTQIGTTNFCSNGMTYAQIGHAVDDTYAMWPNY